MRRYCVEYSEQAWQPRRRPKMLPQHSIEDYQIVQRVLPDGRHLYVELARAHDTGPRVVVARISRLGQRMGWPRHQGSQFLPADALDLIEVPGT